MTTFPHYITTLDYLPLANTFIPAEVPSSKLMIVLHGRGGKAEDFTWIAEKFAFEEMHYLLLNAPKVYEEGYSWYGDDPHQVEGIKDASALLSQTFDLLFKKDFDTSQSFLMGFSQGALLTFEVGARYHKDFAGYIAISGYVLNPTLLLEEIHPERKHENWLCTHGINDDILPYKTSKAQIDILHHGGLKVAFKAYDKGHNIIQEETKMIQTWIETRL